MVSDLVAWLVVLKSEVDRHERLAGYFPSDPDKREADEHRKAASTLRDVMDALEAYERKDKLNRLAREVADLYFMCATATDGVRLPDGTIKRLSDAMSAYAAAKRAEGG